MGMMSINKQGEWESAEKPIILKDALGVLMKSVLFTGFSEAELRAFYPVLQPVMRDYSKGTAIIEEGDPALQIGFVVRGRVVAGKMTSGGRVHIFAVYGTGDDFGFDAIFSSHKASPLTFTADTDCTVLFVSTACFTEQASDTGIRIMTNANRILADRCVRLLYKADILSKQSLRERILTYFGIMEKKSQSEAFLLKMTREQLAQYLCVNRSALSRELGRMQKEGLIEMKQGKDALIKYDIRARSK